MKGGAIAACLKRRRFVPPPPPAPLSTSVHRVSSAETVLWRYASLRGSQDIVIGRRIYDYAWSYYLHQKCFSTGYSSVHGERPSAEYAKLRKEALEGEFGHVLGTYKSKSPSMLGRFVPFLALYRAAIISFQVLKLTFWQLFLYDIRKRSIKFRETLISLGPFYIKLGQALSTRPDILPTVYCQELAKLQDQIPPFPTHLALRSIESQLGVPVSKLFSDISKEPIAAASLGQVYKAHLHSGEVVAVKVQRPGMSYLLTLDAMLFHMIGGQLKRFAKARKDLLVAVNELVRQMFDEIDYIREGQNAERFASLYGYDKIGSKGTAGNYKENRILNGVKVPKIYWNFTHKEVLTMEWIDGIKLTDEKGLGDANLNRKQLIDQGLHSSFGQLLEVGFFHADPHPGNLVATKDGRLAYFDFGMMGHLPRQYRVGLIRMLVHFVNRDSLGLANDYHSLGFIPEGVDLQSVSDALRASFGDGTRQSQDFQSVIYQLADLMYEFDFSLPPDYALVIRALGSLEGTAKMLDPSFKVLESAYSSVIERLLADPDPEMRQILRELLIRNDGSIRWNRLERLIAATIQQATETDAEISPQGKNLNPSKEKSFSMPAVVAATEDLFEFILSDKGSMVRVFLLKDVIKAVDDVLTRLLDDKFQMKDAFESEENATRTRVINGFESFWNAVRLNPELWRAMLIRLSLKQEFQSFAFEIFSALITHCGNRIPDTFWVCISRMIHRLVKKNKIENL